MTGPNRSNFSWPAAFFGDHACIKTNFQIVILAGLERHLEVNYLRCRSLSFDFHFCHDFFLKLTKCARLSILKVIIWDKAAYPGP